VSRWYLRHFGAASPLALIHPLALLWCYCTAARLSAHASWWARAGDESHTMRLLQASDHRFVYIGPKGTFTPLHKDTLCRWNLTRCSHTAYSIQHAACAACCILQHTAA
jgi:hypothetical protein